jgi:glucose/arabinose dehydrogenase
MILALALSIQCSGAADGGADALPPNFTDTLVLGTGLVWPIGLDFLPDGKLIYVEKAGRFGYLNGSSATVLLDISARVRDFQEGGLLGIAVDPDYPTRPYAWVHYTTDAVSPGKVRVSRFTLTQFGGYVQIVPNSEVIWMGYGNDAADNHNGGTVRFDPQKRLVVSLGDDGVQCAAQTRSSPAGKLLRMRVDASADPNDQATLVPPDNPFIVSANVTERLTAIDGLRNPFRFDIDPVTGDYLIGDVGAAAWEEVSVGAKGDNMGWPYFEGNHTYQVSLCAGQGSIPPNVKPIHECDQLTGCNSVMGMLAYRGKNYPNDASFPPQYEGAFFFSDYYAGWLRAIKKNSSSGRWELMPGISATDFGSSYGEVTDMRVGPDGAIYYVRGNGPDQIRRISYVPPAVPELDTLFGAALATGLLVGTWAVLRAPPRLPRLR